MKTYRNTITTEVFAFEVDGSQDHLITANMIAMSPSEVEAYNNPVPTPKQLYAQAKQDKILAVSQIKVTTTSGKAFDGDEVSQNRMARAVTASSVGDTTQWILADNTQASVTHEELKEALLLAGEAMTEIWMA